MRFFQKERLKESLEEIKLKPARYVFIRKGSYIYSLDESKRYVLPKDIYTQVKNDSFRQGVYFIVDKETLSPMYKVQKDYVVPMRYITQLSYQPKKFEFQNPLTRKYIVDYLPTLEHNLYLHWERFYLPIVPNILQTTNGNSNFLFRLEYNLMIDWQLPFKFGLYGDIQSPSYQDSVGTDVRLTQFNGGIVISYPYKTKDTNWTEAIELAGFKSAFSSIDYTNTEGEEVNTKLRSFGFQLKWYKKYHGEKNNVKLGLAYRQMNEGISSTSDTLEVDSKKKSANSFGGFVGVQF